jgi:1,2-diacylglycerol 3-beta-galactosyltransferase
MAITGLPVHPRFTHSLTNKADARDALGWDPNLPAILIVGGSDGMGPLFDTARAINDLKLKCQLAIVAGRNKPLAQKLRTAVWNQPVHIYPFIDYMPRLMAAADILVTKAGPSSISEALIAGLPVILYDRIPGQEEGNVDFVVQNDIGIYSPQSEKVAETVRDWLGEGPDVMRARSDRARSFAEPEATFAIADEIWRFAAPS